MSSKITPPQFSTAGAEDGSPRRRTSSSEREQALERELKVLRTFVEQAPVGVIMLDRQLRCVQVSQHWLETVGVTRDQLLTQNHYECIPNLPEDWKLAHRRGLAGELVSVQEERYVALDGTEHWVSWQITPWGDAGETTGGIFIASEDVTERVHAQQESQKNASSIRSLLESAPQAVIAVNADEKIVLVNRDTETMFGYQREELLGQPLDILVPESVRDRHSKHYQEYFAKMPSRRMGPGTDLTGRRKDGSNFPVEIGLSNYETAEGKFAVAFLVDITQRKRLEQAAQEHAQEIQTLAASLLTAKDEEDRKVSRELHDQICQQLASLAIDIGELVASPLPENVRRRLKALQVRVVKTSEETRHIAHELHSSVIDDLGIIASLRDLCDQFSERNPDAVLKFTGHTAPVVVPRETASCLYRVTQECLQNIAKHAEAKHISVKVTWLKGAAVLRIADDGGGFNLKAVKGQGGLGLIGMEERARLVNGKLTITTQPHHGTRVDLEVPLPDVSLGKRFP